MLFLCNKYHTQRILARLAYYLALPAEITRISVIAMNRILLANSLVLSGGVLLLRTFGDNKELVENA